MLKQSQVEEYENCFCSNDISYVNKLKKQLDMIENIKQLKPIIQSSDEKMVLVNMDPIKVKITRLLNTDRVQEGWCIESVVWRKWSGIGDFAHDKSVDYN